MAFNKKTIKDIDVDGKTVLVRASLNVPIEKNHVEDELRLAESLPTLKYLLDHNSKVILISHHSNKGQSLAPVVPVLSRLIHKKITFVTDCIGPKVDKAIEKMQPGEVLMLENLRFYKGEEANDPEFAKKLAKNGQVYIVDDFTTTHREHASMVGVPKLLPAVAGFQIEKEVNTITEAMHNPKRPLLVIVGGAKISTKIDFLDNFLDKAQALLIGGAMANTFLAAQGLEIGKSLSDSSEIAVAKRVMSDARNSVVELYLPLDVVVTDDVKSHKRIKTIQIVEVGKNDIIADVGHKTIVQIQSLLNKKGTVIWNGPLGISEIPAFAKGSKDLAKRIIDSGSESIAGGGDTAAFLDDMGWRGKFSFVSTGGGASLELMSGKKLPGVEVLQDK